MSHDKKFDLTARYMIFGVAISFLVFLLIGGIITVFFYPFEPLLKYALGLFASAVFSVLRIIMMKRSVEKLSDEGKKSSYQLDYLLRQVLIIGFILLMFVLKAYIGFVGVLAGMFFVKISGYIANYLLTRYEKSHPEEFVLIAPSPEEEEEIKEERMRDYFS